MNKTNQNQNLIKPIPIRVCIIVNIILRDNTIENINSN